MNAPAPKGWCPSLFEPMESGDGLIVRLKPHAATIDAAAARTIADAASRYGNGIVELTNRANLQLRGVRPETLAPITALATRLQLATADPAVERIRSVMASPLGPDDPTAAFDSHALALDIERMLECEPRLAALPAKFGFLVDGGGALPLADAAADVMVRPAAHGVRIELPASDRAAACALVEAVSAVRRLALAFVALSARTPARRMRDLVQAIGAEAMFAEAGLDAVAGATGSVAQKPCVLRQAQDEGESSWHKERPRAELVEARTTPVPGASAVGFIQFGGGGAFGIGLPFGQIEASTLAALADLAERHGDGTLRVTPWRAVLIVGVDATDVAELSAAAESLGLITDPADPRRAIAACPGKPACASATVDARADAQRLAALGITALRGVHVSGCVKGCAHPGAAELTLVGGAGCYALVIDGRAGDRPVARDLSLDDALSLFDQMRASASR